MNYLFLDTETTGLLKNSVMPFEAQPHVIEFFGVLMDEDEVELDRFHTLIKPPVKLDQIITKITGLRDSDLADALPFSVYTDDICRIVSKADAIVAHNASFDITLLEYEFRRCGMIAPWFGELEDSTILMKEIICTVEQTEHVKGYRLSMENLHKELFGEGFSGAHRAEVDTLRLAKCFYEAKKRGWL